MEMPKDNADAKSGSKTAVKETTGDSTPSQASQQPAKARKDTILGTGKAGEVSADGDSANDKAVPATGEKPSHAASEQPTAAEKNGAPSANPESAETSPDMASSSGTETHNGTDPADGEESLRAALAEMNDKFMRALAEAENTRKRAAKERMEAETYGGTRLARDMLSVYDGMKRAVDSLTDEHREAAGPLIEGVELTMRELLNVFSRHGIEIVDPKIGDRFDPNLHEAMFEAPAPNTTAGDIIEVSEQGFKIRDRMLRPAKVGVSSYQP